MRFGGVPSTCEKVLARKVMARCGSVVMAMAVVAMAMAVVAKAVVAVAMMVVAVARWWQWRW